MTPTDHRDTDAFGSAIPFEAAWMSAASYWEPEHYVLSAWLEHASFAAWLVDVIRPRRFVELGTHRGFSFFAVCEAVQRFGLDTRCFAVDSWEGDEHAGYYGDEVHDAVRRVVEEHYAESAQMIRGYFSDVVTEFQDGSVDFLHIDGRHRYEDAKEDFETYLPKLTEDAVVIFHDTVERDNGFGVWRLWAELVERYPDSTFEFQHEHGLGVLALGPRGDGRLEQFFRSGRESGEAVRSTYRRLGHRIAERYQAQVAYEASEDRARALALDRDRIASEATEALDQLVALRSSTSWRATRPMRTIVDRIRGVRQ